MSAQKSIEGTKTEKNLVSAYMAESSAYSRYIYYAKKANKEGFFPIEKVFKETADNELRHSKTFFEYLQGGQVKVSLTVDAEPIGTTAENLAIAADAEHHEGVVAYLASAKIADREGFPDIAAHFRAIAEVESHHEKRFRTLIEQIESGTLWKREQPIEWQCMVCGYIHYGTEPPKECPACDHPRKHYMPLDLNLD